MTDSVLTAPLNFIDGERVPPTNTDDSQDFKVYEPATGKPSLLVFNYIPKLILINSILNTNT